MCIRDRHLEKAIEQLSKLPGTGRKSAQRIAIHLLKQNKQYAQNLAQAILDLTRKYLAVRYAAPLVIPIPALFVVRQNVRSVLFV